MLLSLHSVFSRPMLLRRSPSRLSHINTMNIGDMAVQRVNVFYAEKQQYRRARPHTRSRHSVRTTPQRRPCSKYCLTFYLPWTLAIWHFSDCLIFMLHSRALTTPRFSVSCRSPTVSVVLFSAGSPLILLHVLSVSAHRWPAPSVLYGVPQGSIYCMACHRDRSLDRSCLFYILQMYSSLWETMVSCLTLMPTTLRFWASALLRRPMRSRLRCQTAWTLWHRGWQPTGCSWTTVRQMHFGVRLHVVNIRSRPDPFELEAPQSNQLSSFGTSGSNLTLTSPCALMWLQQSVHASLLCDRSVAYDILCRVQPCWP